MFFFNSFTRNRQLQEALLIDQEQEMTLERVYIYIHIFFKQVTFHFEHWVYFKAYKGRDVMI